MMTLIHDKATRKGTNRKIQILANIRILKMFCAEPQTIGAALLNVGRRYSLADHEQARFEALLTNGFLRLTQQKNRRYYSLTPEGEAYLNEHWSLWVAEKARKARWGIA